MSLPGEKIPSGFRCAECGSLFEVVYPWSSGGAGGSVPNPSAFALALAGAPDEHAGD